jgi:guanine deaminase
MCLAAIYWARIPKVFYGNSRQEAAAIGFDDDFIYQQIPLAVGDRKVSMKLLLNSEAKGAFLDWSKKTDKVAY